MKVKCFSYACGFECDTADHGLDDKAWSYHYPQCNGENIFEAAKDRHKNRAKRDEQAKRWFEGRQQNGD